MGKRAKVIICVSFVILLVLLIGFLVLYPWLSFYWHFNIEYDEEYQAYALVGVKRWKKEVLVLPQQTPDGEPIVLLRHEKNHENFEYRYDDEKADFVLARNDTVKKLVIPDSYQELRLGGNDFLALEEVVIGKSVIKIYGGYFCESNMLSSISVDPENTMYFSEGNCIIERETKKLVVGCRTSSIPHGVEIIGEASFAFVPIEKIEIPDSVRVIEMSAFVSCPLEQITIPSNVVEIKRSAIYDCSQLTIFCSLETKPDGWDDECFRDVKKIIWGGN